MNEEQKRKEEEYLRVLGQILDAIDGENKDDVVPALVSALSCVMHFEGIPKTIMLSFVADSFDLAEKTKQEKEAGR